MKQPSSEMVALRDVSIRLGNDDAKEIRFSLSEFEVERGEAVALTGPSGCGKSTLLNLISGMRRADRGSIRVSGTEISSLGEAAIDQLRSRVCGHVFQSFHLLAPFNALENVMIGLRFSGIRGREGRKRAEAALNRVGLSGRMHSLPATLSVGERQRVAIARAIAPDPPLLLADEPTGALDLATGREIFALLRETALEAERTLLLVTHDEALASQLPHRFDCSSLISTTARQEGGRLS
ncbi:MAG: ABC transporter ATP-binding protein [Verrucomicrobiota bacterium]